MPLLLASFSFVLFMHHDALVYSPPAVYDAHKKAAADLPLHAAATSVEATPRRWPPSTRRSRRHPQSHTQYPLPPYLCTQPPPSTSLYTQWPPSPRKPRAAVIAALPRDSAATDLPLHAVAPPPPQRHAPQSPLPTTLCTPQPSLSPKPYAAATAALPVRVGAATPSLSEPPSTSLYTPQPPLPPSLSA